MKVHYLEDGYYVNELEKEIERLNNKVKEQSLLLIEFQDMEQRLKEKESIIKEVREYIEYYLTKGKTKNHKQFETSILEILDKGEINEII